MFIKFTLPVSFIKNAALRRLTIIYLLPVLLVSVVINSVLGLFYAAGIEIVILAVSAVKLARNVAEVW
jgi:hypothetical protein